MAGLNLGGGFAAYAGYQEAVKDNEDREHTRAQRDFQGQQQQRQKQQWQREDTQRIELANIDPNVPMDVQLRKRAAVAKTAGDWDAYRTAHDEADKIALDRAEKQVQTLLTGSQNMTAAQLATDAARVMNADPVPGGIENIRDDGNGGVVMTVKDRLTGQTTERAFADIGQTRDWLQAYRAPKVYAALQQLKQAAAIKAQEKIAEPYTLKLGERRMVGDKVVAEGGLPAGYEALTDGAGNQVLRKIAPGTGGGGTGTAAGKVNPKEEPVAQARAVLKDILAQDKESPPEVRGAAETYLEAIVTSVPGVTPAAAANVAMKVARNPALIKPTLNANTGQLDGVFRDQMIAGGRPFTIANNFMTVQEAEAAFKDDKTFMRKQVSDMVGKQAAGLSKTVEVDGQLRKVPISAQEVQAIQQAYVQAAFDTRVRAQLTDAAAKAGPEAVASLGRKLDLIARYMDPPAAARTPVVRRSGGLAAAASHATRRQMADEVIANRKAAAEARAAEAPHRAKQLLESGTPKELYEFQGTEEFGSLDRATRLAIHQRLMGARPNSRVAAK